MKYEFDTNKAEVANSIVHNKVYAVTGQEICNMNERICGIKADIHTLRYQLREALNGITSGSESIPKFVAAIGQILDNLNCSQHKVTAISGLTAGMKVVECLPVNKGE